jgi:hypothetical protein
MMSKSLQLVFVLVVAVGAIASVGSYAQNPKQADEGSSSYTPTKLEWLALRCNVEHESDGEIKTIFRPHPEKVNTLEAEVVHGKQVEPRMVKAYGALAKRTATRISQQYGWNWVEIDVQSNAIISSLSE